MSKIDKVKKIFKPLDAPLPSEPLHYPNVRQDLEPFKKVEDLIERWKKTCKGPLTESAATCSSIKCPHRTDDSNQVQSCAYWNILKAEIGKFDLGDAQKQLTEVYIKLFAQASGLRNFFERQLTLRNMVLVYIAFEFIKAVGNGLAWVVMNV